MTEFVFQKEDNNVFTLMIDGQQSGGLYFNDKFNAWVFDWGDGGVVYEHDLKETEEELRYEFEDGLKDDTMPYFGNYEYKK